MIEHWSNKCKHPRSIHIMFQTVAMDYVKVSPVQNFSNTVCLPFQHKNPRFQSEILKVGVAPGNKNIVFSTSPNLGYG